MPIENYFTSADLSAVQIELPQLDGSGQVETAPHPFQYLNIGGALDYYFWVWILGRLLNYNHLCALQGEFEPIIWDETAEYAELPHKDVHRVRIGVIGTSDRRKVWDIDGAHATFGVFGWFAWMAGGSFHELQPIESTGAIFQIPRHSYADGFMLAPMSGQVLQAQSYTRPRGLPLALG